MSQAILAQPARKIQCQDLSESQFQFQVFGRDANEFEARCYHGAEGLSQLFRFEVELASRDGALPLDGLIGRGAALFVQGKHGQRVFNGIISKFESVGEQDGEYYYHAELVPRLWRLTHRYCSRIFQGPEEDSGLTVREIITQVLSGAGIPSDSFSFHLTGKHPRRSYCVQYRETDFNFISRLMEEEGIFYFFEHTADSHRLIMADSRNVYLPTPGGADVPYVAPTGMQGSVEHLARFSCSNEVRPGKVVLRDFNFRDPDRKLETHGNSKRDQDLEIADFPGEYDGDGDGFELARIRAEELDCHRVVARGVGTVLRLQPGKLFGLTGHPRTSHNTGWLTTRVSHRGVQGGASSFDHQGGDQGAEIGLANAIHHATTHHDPAIRQLAGALMSVASRNKPDRPRPRRRALPRWLVHGGRAAIDPATTASATGADPFEPWSAAADVLNGVGMSNGENGALYECTVECIPSGVTFRPPRVTPWPKMRGCQTAIVVGDTKDEQIYTDKHGRVKVQFAWDRTDRHDHGSSCWIRVSQPWAGAGYGGMTIPRVGQEVIVDFVEGDPDRPIIVGRVYNGKNQPPQDLPKNKMRSSIRSNTYKGSGSNEITMDDTAGKEHFYMKSQFDKTEEIGNNRNTSVGKDSVEVIANNCVETVGNNKSTDVTNAYAETCDTYVLNAKTSITLQCGASRIHMNQAGFISITGTVITSAATINNSVAAPMTEVAGAVMLTCAGAVVLVEGGVTHVRGEALAAVKGGKVNSIAGGDNIVQGAIVKIN